MLAGQAIEDSVQWQAVEAVGKDEVLVIDARGDTDAASYGHILATRLQRRGVTGLVTDGCLRAPDSPNWIFPPTVAIPTQLRQASSTTRSRQTSPLAVPAFSCCRAT